MDTKDKQLHMRLSPSEAIALQQLAKRKGLSKSSYLRQYIRRQAKRSRIPV